MLIPLGGEEISFEADFNASSEIDGPRDSAFVPGCLALGCTERINSIVFLTP